MYYNKAVYRKSRIIDAVDDVLDIKSQNVDTFTKMALFRLLEMAYIEYGECVYQDVERAWTKIKSLYTELHAVN